MSRVEALGQATPTNTDTSLTLSNLTLSGTNRLVYIAVYVLHGSLVRSVDTITIGGSTVYDLGVDESAIILDIAAAIEEATTLEVFRFFDGDLPANGERDVVVTLDGAPTNGFCVTAISYDDADQTTGHRGTPVSWNDEDGSYSIAVTADGADQESIAILCNASSTTFTPSGSTTEVHEVARVNTRQALWFRTSGGTPLTGSGGDTTREMGWAASILSAAGESLVGVVDEGMNIAGATSRQSIAIIGS
jgi:hypothetical protein